MRYTTCCAGEIICKDPENFCKICEEIAEVDRFICRRNAGAEGVEKMKRIAALLLVILAMWSVAQADAYGYMTSIAAQVPVIYVSDRYGQVTALTDDSTATVWYCPAEYNAQTDSAALSSFQI